MSESSDTESNRVPPLNLSKEEAEFLWELMKREIVKEEVQYSDDRAVAESLHTKVLNITEEADD